MSESNERLISWTLADAIAFYDRFGHLGPYAISGGSGDGDGDGDGAGDGGKKGDGAEDVAGLKSALQAERDARKTEEKTRKDLEKRLATIENSGKSESEKLSARLKELEDANATKDAAIRERDAKDAALDTAGKLGADAKNAGVIWRAIKGDVEYDDTGKPENLKTLIDDLKETTPHLFRAATGKADAGAGNNGGRPKNFDMNSQIRQMAGRGT